jgi:segregation and condensation protein B
MSNELNQNSRGSSALTEEMRVLEALLFASDNVMSPQELKSIIPGEPNARAIRKMVESVNAELQRQRHPFEIVELGGGYQFRTVGYYHPWVRKLLKEKTTKRLSVQALECLAIIAYKQPITKAEIEAIRGVISDGAMKTLLERHLVTIAGRSDKPGRPLLYGTSKEFLEYFGINKIADLPRIEEFEAMAREKMEQLSDDEVAMLDSAPDEEDFSGETPTEPQNEQQAQASSDTPMDNSKEQSPQSVDEQNELPSDDYNGESGVVSEKTNEGQD